MVHKRPKAFRGIQRETPEFTRKSSLRLDLRKYRVYILDGASHIECARRVKYVLVATIIVHRIYWYIRELLRRSSESGRMV